MLYREVPKNGDKFSAGVLEYWNKEMMNFV